MMTNSVLLLHRVANGAGVRALNTSFHRLCEKKNKVDLSNEDDGTNAEKVVEPKQTPTLETQKSEDDSKAVKMAEQNEEPAVTKTDDESTTQQLTDIKTEKVVASQKQVKTDTSRSGKEGLLDLLGEMKVEVTNKRRLKNLKAKQFFESTPVSNPSAMESTISMFQQATGEASPQR